MDQWGPEAGFLKPFQSEQWALEKRLSENFFLAL